MNHDHLVSCQSNHGNDGTYDTRFLRLLAIRHAKSWIHSFYFVSDGFHQSVLNQIYSSTWKLEHLHRPELLLTADSVACRHIGITTIGKINSREALVGKSSVVEKKDDH